MADLTTQPRVALVTGANRGIGAATVRALADAGWSVFAAARQPELVDEAERVHPLALDVSEDDSIRAAHDQIAARLDGRGLDVLINNAGTVVQGPVELLAREQIRWQYEVNVVGAMSVTRLFLPLLRRARGRVINLGAATGRTPIPYLGASGSSKAALAAFSDALRVEVRPFGVRVSLIEPAVVATTIFADGARAADRAAEDFDPEVRALYDPGTQAVCRATAGAKTASAQTVAETVLQAATARRPKSRYVVGWQARQLTTLSLLPDRLRDRLIARELRLNLNRSS